jgi:hypothetical protein
MLHLVGSTLTHLEKMVRKELLWLLQFAGSVAVNMTWEEFVVLGERGLSRDKGFGEELERIRLVLRGSSGLNSLTFVQNACDGSGSNKEGDR